jgi:glycosyltransferase involved in cell wall biosynthesis
MMLVLMPVLNMKANNMKILFVQKMNGISGSELYLLQIMPELKRRGYDIEMLIIYPTSGDNNKRYIEYLAEHGIKTHEIYGHLAFSPLLFRKIAKLLKNGQFDLVQSNLIHADFWLAVVKKFLVRSTKLISVKHGYYPAYQAKYGNDLRKIKHNLYYWIAKFASNVANFNVTISKGLYDVYVNGGIVRAAHIRNIYYGLTLTAPVEQGKTVEIPEGPYALITGRLVGFKGHPYLIQAWEKIHALHPEFKLCIAGDGDCREALEKQVVEAGLQKGVIFMGHVPDPHPLMEKCLFTLVTSNWEGFGLILLESWLHKKAIVAFDAPAMNEVIDDEKNGLLASANDVDQLAEKISYLYTHNELAVQYGQAGYEKLNSFYTLKRMTDEMEEVYIAVQNNKKVPLQ